MSTASGKRARGARPRHGGAAGDGPHRDGTTRAVGSEDEAAPQHRAMRLLRPQLSSPDTLEYTRLQGNSVDGVWAQPPHGP